VKIGYVGIIGLTNDADRLDDWQNDGIDWGCEPHSRSISIEELNEGREWKND